MLTKAVQSQRRKSRKLRKKPRALRKPPVPRTSKLNPGLREVTKRNTKKL